MNILLEEPLIRPLIAVTKRYNSILFEKIKHLDLLRYHFVLLRIEENNQQLTQKALSQLINIDKSFMVSIIDYLSDKGYVRRERNDKDRREQLIKLTDKAIEELPVIRKAVSETNKKTLKNINKSHLSIFKEVLQAIQINLADSKPMTNFIDFKTTSIK